MKKRKTFYVDALPPEGQEIVLWNMRLSENHSNNFKHKVMIEWDEPDKKYEFTRDDIRGAFKDKIAPSDLSTCLYKLFNSVQE